MTVWHLSFLVCSTLNSALDDGAYTTICRWQPDGVLYASESICLAEGEKQLGKPVFSDVYDGSRSSRTKVRCWAQSVSQ